MSTVRRAGGWAAATATLALAGSGPGQAQTAGPPASRVTAIAGDAVAMVTPYVGPSRGYGFGVASVPFELPAGSKQGSGRWFLLRLKVALVLCNGLRGAPAQVSAATNGFTAIQMQVEPAGNREAAVIDTLDLLQGELRQVSKKGLAVVDESNYVQLAGVHGGRNRLSIRIDAFGRATLVESARLLPGTGIYETPKAPSNYSHRRSSLIVVLVCIAAFVPAALALGWPRLRRRRGPERIR